MPGGLAVELAKIDHARAALTAGDPVTALRELDAFERAHPGSSLTEDAWVVRFDALVAKGERAEAREVARTFVRRWPSSPYVTRIRRTIDGEP